VFFRRENKLIEKCSSAADALREPTLVRYWALDHRRKRKERSRRNGMKDLRIRLSDTEKARLKSNKREHFICNWKKKKS
jgi:hypothetical protein